MDTGFEAVATEAGVNIAYAIGLGLVIFPFVDMLKKYLGKFGDDVIRLAYIMAFAVSFLITLAKVGGGSITGWAILSMIVRGFVTALIAVALGKARQTVPDNRPAAPADDTNPPLAPEGFAPRPVKDASE